MEDNREEVEVTQEGIDPGQISIQVVSVKSRTYGTQTKQKNKRKREKKIVRVNWNKSYQSKRDDFKS